MEPGEAMKELGMRQHRLRFTSTLLLEDDGPPTMTTDKIYHDLKRFRPGTSLFVCNVL